MKTTKARVMWVYRSCLKDSPIVHLHHCDDRITGTCDNDMVRVLVLPIDPDSLAAARERIERALTFGRYGPNVGSATQAAAKWQARAVLSAMHPALRKAYER